MKSMITDDLTLSSSSVLLQRRKLDFSFEPRFHTLLSLSALALKKKEPQRNEKQNENEVQKEKP
jgi:non-ribosomal peptide synthetase component F